MAKVRLTNKRQDSINNKQPVKVNWYIYDPIFNISILLRLRVRLPLSKAADTLRLMSIVYTQGGVLLQNVPATFLCVYVVYMYALDTLCYKAFVFNFFVIVFNGRSAFTL